MVGETSTIFRTRLTVEQRKHLDEFRSRHKTGVLTLLFIDMVDSTRLKQLLGDATGTSLVEDFQASIRNLLSGFPEAQEINTAGDSFFLAFIRPSDSVNFALQFQASLRKSPEDSERLIRVRIGIHMGEVFFSSKPDLERPKDILGFQVDTAARIMGLANADQILLSKSVFDNARVVLRSEEIPVQNELSWLNHGPYRLSGIEDPLEICEVGEVEHAPLSVPPDSAKARRVIAHDQSLDLRWRPALDLEIPTSKGWILNEKIGEGGFGEVWRAHRKGMLDTRVFKFCFQEDRVRSLKREATLFQKLRDNIGEHPNVVRIYETYFDEPPFFVSMEDVSGQNLIDWCEQYGGPGAVPEPTKLEIVAQVAYALRIAHESGIIHRDVKPSNIIVVGEPTPDRVHVKLSDFGIGSFSDDLRDKQSGFTETFSTTEISQRSGTRIYMAPEVLSGHKSTIQSDIYSLGVILYQFLIGDFGRPITIDWGTDIDDRILRYEISRYLAGDPDKRPRSTKVIGENLRYMENKPKKKSPKVSTPVAKQGESQSASIRPISFILHIAGIGLLVLIPFLLLIAFFRMLIA